MVIIKIRLRYGLLVAADDLGGTWRGGIEVGGGLGLLTVVLHLGICLSAAVSLNLRMQ